MHQLPRSGGAARGPGVAPGAGATAAAASAGRITAGIIIVDSYSLIGAVNVHNHVSAGLRGKRRPGAATVLGAARGDGLLLGGRHRAVPRLRTWIEEQPARHPADPCQ